MSSIDGLVAFRSCRRRQYYRNDADVQVEGTFLMELARYGASPSLYGWRFAQHYTEVLPVPDLAQFASDREDEHLYSPGCMM